jgi:aminomethyltransferase
MENKTKTTPLHDWHLTHGANMAEFGGYHMPLWYSSAKNEHLAPLTSAGIFDTSHMAVVLVNGPDAHDLLQLCFTNDMDRCIGKSKKPIFPGRCVYGAYLNASGGVIDDTIIYKLEEDDYMAVVNAAMGGRVAEHLKTHKGGRNVEITDLTDQAGKIDVQGPLSAKILAAVVKDPEKVFEKLPYFAFKGHFESRSSQADQVRLLDGTPILLSRTGYTGEFGFEIFIGAENTVRLWDMILEAGQPLGVVPCGLAARDSLRCGAVLPLSHQDIGDWPFIHHPWPFALAFTDDRSNFTKKFIGAQALLEIESCEYTYAFVGKDLRKVSTGDPAVVRDADGNEVGRVLSCATDMGIGRHKDRIYSIASPGRPEGFKPKGLCCGFVKVNTKMASGQTIEIEDNRRRLKVTIVDDIRPDRTARLPLKKML